MFRINRKLKFYIFLKNLLRKDVNWVCEKIGISRATFYRHKKRLNGKMVRTER